VPGARRGAFRSVAPALVGKYAPKSENDSDLYARQMVEWSARWREKLGIT
jgi:hypothetical protein